ncbi:MAG: cytochrome c3 family protein [Gemmatimonadota bacterium]
MRGASAKSAATRSGAIGWYSCLAALVLLLAGAAVLPAQIYQRAAPAPFPHDRHAKLFPTCAGCHAGLTTGDSSTVMPPVALCAQCHDGTVRPRVAYTAPQARSDFLRFRHATHAAQVEESGRACATCHAARDGAPWMNVRRAPPESCQGCHTHRSGGHLADDSRCTTCHIAIARSTTVTVEQLRSLPEPPSHADARFPLHHGVSAPADIARCATCHARETCALCHVNAATVPAIAQLPADPRAATMMRGRTVSYATPDDHRSDDWSSAHRTQATTNVQRCGVCHAQASCSTCHSGSLGREVIRQLPDGRTGAPGVQLELPRGHDRAMPVAAGRVTLAPAMRRTARPHAPRTGSVDTITTTVRPHPDGFARQHAASAASGRLSCEGCHTQRFCSDCHAGESKRDFHVANFVVRHAADSYGRDLECAGCHNTEVFCRACHQAQGIASKGRGAGTYHNGQPLWLLQHGQAARQGLESCTTCHTQRDCMQCHSQRGWGVNPHGDDFDASRLGARAKAMCARCHLADPTRGR